MFFLQPQIGGPNAPLPEPAKAILTAQVICGAMIMGVLMFLGVTLMMPGPANPPLIAYVALAFALLQTGLRFVIPEMVARGQLQKLAGIENANLDAQLFGVFLTKMIIGLALLESAGLFNLVAYIVEHQWWSHVVAGVLVLLMGMMFPTLNQFESWAEDAKRNLHSQF